MDFHMDEAALRRLVEPAVKNKIEDPLNRLCAQLQTEMAGQPVDDVLAELQRRVATEIPVLQDPNPEVLRKLAEKISGATA